MGVNGVGIVEEGPCKHGPGQREDPPEGSGGRGNFGCQDEGLGLYLESNGSTEKIKMNFGIKKQKQNQKTLFDQPHGSTKGGLNETEGT